MARKEEGALGIGIEACILAEGMAGALGGGVALGIGITGEGIHGVTLGIAMTAGRVTLAWAGIH